LSPAPLSPLPQKSLFLFLLLYPAGAMEPAAEAARAGKAPDQTRLRGPAFRRRGLVLVAFILDSFLAQLISGA
jgi:hypothetical protein